MELIFAKVVSKLSFVRDSQWFFIISKSAELNFAILFIMVNFAKWGRNCENKFHKNKFSKNFHPKILHDGYKDRIKHQQHENMKAKMRAKINERSENHAW